MTVEFSRDGWSFEAQIFEGADPCRSSTHVPLATLSSRTWRVPPVGPPGPYRVDLLGRGPGGSMAAAFVYFARGAGTSPRPWDPSTARCPVAPRTLRAALAGR